MRCLAFFCFFYFPKGRIDMQLFVGTPNLDARVILFEQALDKIVGVVTSDEIKAEAVATYRDFLSSEWTNDAMFMNYLEGKQFANSVAAIVASGRRLERNELQRILSQQATVMTARGVRVRLGSTFVVVTQSSYFTR
jgi:hypothetical protein